jgi:hypothetical protein
VNRIGKLWRRGFAGRVEPPDVRRLGCAGVSARGGGVAFAVVFALAAAFSNAVNLMTQHSASVTAPNGRRAGGGPVPGPAAAVAARGCHWGGLVCLPALALHNGPMSVIQPVLVTELVFVLVLRRVWIGQDVTRAAAHGTGRTARRSPPGLAGGPSSWRLGRAFRGTPDTPVISAYIMGSPPVVSSTRSCAAGTNPITLCRDRRRTRHRPKLDANRLTLMCG